MGSYRKGRRYGFLTPENNGGFYKNIQHQQVGAIPGKVANAYTYDI